MCILIMENAKKYFSGVLVRLIPFEEEHIEIVREWINNEDMTLYMGTRFPVSKNEQKIWYENVCNDKTKKKLIISDVSNKNVGMISLFNIDLKNRKAEIGIYISPENQKRGYAKEAVGLMVDFAFGEMNMNKIYATIQSGNEASESLFVSVGFGYESTDIGSIYSRGAYVDTLKYTIFREDIF